MSEDTLRFVGRAGREILGGASGSPTGLGTIIVFTLEDLGVGKLAKRCQIKGKHWANPGHYDEDFIKRADISLERMERLARELIRDIKR